MISWLHPGNIRAHGPRRWLHVVEDNCVGGGGGEAVHIRHVGRVVVGGTAGGEGEVLGGREVGWAWRRVHPQGGP